MEHQKIASMCYPSISVFQHWGQKLQNGPYDRQYLRLAGLCLFTKEHIHIQTSQSQRRDQAQWGYAKHLFLEPLENLEVPFLV